jgi:hypothetical protein
VLAHVPDINDFVSGVSRLLGDHAVATFEFPHLLKTVAGSQFDTIYHEHFSYLSLGTVTTIFERNGLRAFDVDELPTHGGSLRVYAQRADGPPRAVTSNLARVRQQETAAGMFNPHFYAGFQNEADRIKDEFLTFLLGAKREGRIVAAYGAAAKGNTLLNYAGIRHDLLPLIADRNPAKQGTFTPGGRIPIVDECRLREMQPAFVVILPWNLRAELTGQLAYIESWGGRFVTAVPNLEIFP